MKRPLVLPAVAHDDTAFQELIQFFNETLGFCPNSVKTMYHRPRIAYGFIEMNKAVMENKGRVTSALKRLIGYISSHAAGCRYCQGAYHQGSRTLWGRGENGTYLGFQNPSGFFRGGAGGASFALLSSCIPNGVDDAIADKLRAILE